MEHEDFFEELAAFMHLVDFLCVVIMWCVQSHAAKRGFTTFEQETSLLSEFLHVFISHERQIDTYRLWTVGWTEQATSRSYPAVRATILLF